MYRQCIKLYMSVSRDWKR